MGMTIMKNLDEFWPNAIVRMLDKVINFFNPKLINLILFFRQMKGGIDRFGDEWDDFKIII